MGDDVWVVVCYGDIGVMSGRCLGGVVLMCEYRHNVWVIFGYRVWVVFG